MDNAFPAGDESDASNDEWDIGCDKKSPRVKVNSENVPHFSSNRFMLLEASSNNIAAL